MCRGGNNMEFHELLLKRRSVYSLSDEVTIDEKTLKDGLALAIQNAPTAFDSRATHIIIALGENHHFVWDTTMKTLKEIVPEKKFPATKAKLETFRKSYGTILVYKDLIAIEELKASFPTFAGRQDDWGEQNIGILVYALWLELANLGLGASIQHYDPLIDKGLEERFKTPASWKLETEIVFGKTLMEPMKKEYDELDSRLKIAK